MNLLLVYACVLLVGVLVSSLAERSVLSTSVLFLAAGFVAGPEVLGVIRVSPNQEALELLVHLALFAVLFTDGMQVGWRDLRSTWRLPGRALLLGMPLTMLFTAVAAHTLLGIGWLPAALLGAILSPTDPVFASAIVGREELPLPLRRLLNVESGVNDGLALPVVVIFLSLLEGSAAELRVVAAQLVGGVLIGVAVPAVALKLEQSRYFAASSEYRPLNAVAIGLLVLALSQALHANLFLAAFVAGMTMASIGSQARAAFERFGNLIVELLKLASLLLLGAQVSSSWFAGFPAGGYLFVAAVLLLIRPVAVGLAMLGSSLGWRERAVAFWFGPKGFASMAYGLLVYHSSADGRVDLFHWIALTVAVSVVAHSSTDVVIAQWMRRADSKRRQPATNGEERGESA